MTDTLKNLDYRTVQFFLTSPTIEPMELTRSPEGHCAHPGVPWALLDEYPVAPFFRAWGYEFDYALMQNDVEDGSPEMVAWDEGDGSFLSWRPLPPDGPGWILIGIADTEDGPSAWWVRKPDRRTRSLDALAEEIAAWQDVTFPQKTPHSVATHLVKEATDLLDAPTDAKEIADVFMLVVAAARVNGVSLAGAVAAKLVENKARVWGTPDVDGVVRHVEAAP